MAETATVGKSRWTDKWPVKVMVMALAGTAMLGTAGASWMVGRVVANETTDARQDANDARHEAEIKSMREEMQREHREVLDNFKDLKAEIRELRK